MERGSTYLAVQAKKCPVFDGIGIESLSALFACLGVKRRRLEKGDALMRTGERADRIGILLSGSLSVSAYDLGGRRTIIKRIGPGEIVAAAQALSGADAMSVDVEADGDCDVLLVKTDRILSPCENACAFHSRLVRNIMRTLAAKTLELNRKIDGEIVTGNGSGQLKGLNQSGNYTDYITPAGLASGDTCIDLILKVSSAMRAANIQNLTLLINPMDWVKVVGAKNANKDYLIPGILDVPGQRIWGIPVVQSGSVTQGKFHMGDFYQGAKVVERTGLGVEIARTEDDFLKNLYTLRVERRLDFAVVQPKCLAYGNFADVA